MKRSAARAMVAAAFAVVIAMATTPASSQRCDPETTWRYCGEHVPSSRLPLRFAYDQTSAPVGGGVTGAIDAAMRSWNLAWPGNKVACNPLCRNASGSSTITWGNPASCPDTSPDAVAVACITYDPPGSERISRVDIILNAAKPWKVAGAADAALAEARGAVWGNLMPVDWYDVQSVLTHELGHALGLEHIGNAQEPFPHDLTDSWKYTQTMYRWSKPGTTSMRSLEAGDIAGLQRAAADSIAD